MHGSLEKPGETIKGIYRSWGIGLFALPVLLVAFLIGLAITKPDVSNWISETAQVEFAGPKLMPEVTPTQLAQPAMAIRAAKSN
jgi:hypothetical protein